MPKLLLLLISLLVIVMASFIAFLTQNSPQGYKPGSWPEADTAVNQAQRLFKVEKEKGRDLSSGPCLSNALMPGWVVDIVHSPRQPTDNLVENQCSAYLGGGRKHFVELDLEGEVIMVR